MIKLDNYADTTLLSMTKRQLVEYIRMLEYNLKVSDEQLENQAKYFEQICKKSNKI